MSKYLKPHRLIDTTGARAAVVATGQQTKLATPSEHQRHGYTDGDLILFDTLCNALQALAPAYSSASDNKPHAVAEADYTRQDTEHFQRLSATISTAIPSHKSHSARRRSGTV